MIRCSSTRRIWIYSLPRKTFFFTWESWKNCKSQTFQKTSSFRKSRLQLLNQICYSFERFFLYLDNIHEILIRNTGHTCSAFDIDSLNSQHLIGSRSVCCIHHILYLTLNALYWYDSRLFILCTTNRYL